MARAVQVDHLQDVRIFEGQPQVLHFSLHWR